WRDRPKRAQDRHDLIGDLEIGKEDRVAHLYHPIRLERTDALLDLVDRGPDRAALGLGNLMPNRAVTMREFIGADLDVVTLLPVLLLGRGIALAFAAALGDRHEAAMRRIDVVRILAVLELHLPIPAIGVGDAARNDLHRLRSLLHMQVDEEFEIAEMLLERRHVGREAAEDQPLIGRELRQRDEIMALGIESRRIIRRLALLDRDNLSGAVIGPAVIETDVEFRIPLLETADRRAFVTAGIEERADIAFCVARDDHRRAADPGRYVIMRLGELRFDGEEIPRALEDVFHLELENLRIGIDVAMYPEHALIGPVVDIEAGWLHGHTRL